MTLDKAIDIYEKGAKLTWNGKPTVEAEECQQMMEWLKELKAHREAWDGIKEGLLEMSRLHEYVSIKHMIQLIDEVRPKEVDTK